MFEFPYLIYVYFRLKPDIVNGVYTIPKGLYCVLLSKITKVRVVTSVIGSEKEIITYLPFSRIWQKLNVWILNNSHLVTTKGDKVSNYLINKAYNMIDK